jgi:hypothetical protein
LAACLPAIALAAMKVQHTSPQFQVTGFMAFFAEDNRRCNVELLRSRRSVQRQKEDCSYNVTRFSSLFYFLILEKSLISIYNIYYMRIIEERAMISFSIYEFDFRPAPIEQAGNLLQKRGS